MVPELGGRVPANRRDSVDFPQPDSPTMPSVRPDCSVRLTSLTAKSCRGACGHGCGTRNDLLRRSVRRTGVLGDDIRVPGQQACGCPARVERHRRRHLRRAARLGDGTARMKGAARRQLGRRRWRAGDPRSGARLHPAAALLPAMRRCRDARGEQTRPLPFRFPRPARVHHQHPVRHLGDNTHIVSDEQDRHPQLRAQPGE